MQSHTKNYLKSTGKLPHEIYCEKCGSNSSIDIHHLQNRQKNRPDLDEAWNLVALCRTCHAWIHAHNTAEHKQMLKELISNRKTVDHHGHDKQI